LISAVGGGRNGGREGYLLPRGGRKREKKVFPPRKGVFEGKKKRKFAVCLVRGGGGEKGPIDSTLWGKRGELVYKLLKRLERGNKKRGEKGISFFFGRGGISATLRKGGGNLGK